ncbi:PVC-type heme-binding CxxCH protein [Verrucomicrobiaceae bacterium 227]
MTKNIPSPSVYRRYTLLAGLLTCLLGFCFNLSADSKPDEPQFLAGAYVQDVTPPFDDLLINGGFLERRRGKMSPGDLQARCFVLQRGEVSIAIAVVDSCMIPREVCDEAKALAAKATGIPVERIVIAATHTHSAPGTMDYCLGTMADPAYTKFLPGKIAEGIARAHSKLEPAQIGWKQVKATGFTHCRRWITRPDQMLEDPFGEKTVRAMMHPGFQNPNYIGPSGPADDELSVLSIQALDGSPLAVLANFSMHYHGGGDGPADYFGLFSDRLAKELTVDGRGPVCAMTQGTSGDLYLRDYSGEEKGSEISSYTNGLVEIAKGAVGEVHYQTNPALGMAQQTLTLSRRLPDAQRLDWADKLLAPMKGRRPKNRPEVYAEQARFIHENPTEELVLQTLRIGELGITMSPNEVYAITGLKLKARSPFASTFNIELANGASGYIPPPEQHALGGYTTWPARTAGLEVEAEPKIVEALLTSLESLSGENRRGPAVQNHDYAKAILADKPLAYWQCEEFDGSQLSDVSGNNRSGQIDGVVAYHLAGPASETFIDNSAIQLAGGTLSTSVPDARSLSFWFWNGMVSMARDNTGDLVQLGESLRLRIGGKGDGDSGASLIVQDGEQQFKSSSKLKLHTWHHVLLSHDGKSLSLFLDGNSTPEIRAEISPPPSSNYRFGGTLPFEGRLDEVAFFDKIMGGSDARRHYEASGLKSISTTEQTQHRSGPLSPDEALEAVQIPKGFTVELVASEPLVKDPVAIDWGADGKLWVAEMADYPSGIDGQPGGRVRFLEDLDGDGEYDQSTLFLEGLNFPAGIMSRRKGVLIAAAPDIIYAEDSTGDGKADIRTILFTGFKQGNQQLRVNGLSWGLDNWVHGANGSHYAGYAKGSKISSPLFDHTVDLESFDFRMQPDLGLMEPLSGPSQFGRARDDWGNAFGVQNSYPLWHYVLEQRYLGSNPDYPAPDPRRQLRPKNARVFPASQPQKRFHSFDNSGRYTSACSPMIYRDDLLFQDEAIHAFTCEPFHNLVQHMTLKRDGYSFTAERSGSDDAPDFFASEDRWSRPVMARTGPDGALWVVDMYRYMIEHPDWLPTEGKEEMKPHERKGSDFGRIYRIFREGRSPRPIPRLAKVSSDKLVSTLSNRNGVVRDLAHRLLIERKEDSVSDLLIEMTKGHHFAQARLHALCVLDGIGRLGDDVLQSAFADSHHEIRRHALRLAESRWSENSNLLSKAIPLMGDPDPAVRLQAACSLSTSDDPTANEALIRFGGENADDIFIRALVFNSALAKTEWFTQAILAHDNLIGELIATQKDFTQASRDLVIAHLSDPEERGVRAAQLKTLGIWLDRFPEDLSKLDGLLKMARAMVVDPKVPDKMRAAATCLLGRQGDLQEADQAQLIALISPQASIVLKSASLEALARLGRSDLPGVFFNSWPAYSPQERTRILDVLFRRKDWMLASLRAAEKGEISRSDFDTSRKQLLLTHEDGTIRETAENVLSSGVKTKRKDQIEPFRAALQLDGSGKRGRIIFDQRCAVCHAPPNGQASNGPDLRAITDRSAEGLFSSILDPNQSVDPSYTGYSVSLADGSSLYGRVLTENTNHLTLRQLDGSDRQLPRREIKALISSELSLMPEGLEVGLSHQNLADLISYLQILGDGGP